MMGSPIGVLRERVVTATTGLFAHARYPLEDTLRHRGDAGLCGPESISWSVLGDTSAFVGGVRALLVQAAHPEVAAGVADHSRYQDDPLGRLSRTSAYVTATTFGAMPEVEQAVAIVRRAHRPIHGESHRGVPYSADAPALAAWVHNVLTDSFLQAYRDFGPGRLTPEEEDRFVAEQARIGRLLEADPLPESAGELRGWIVGHPALDTSPGLREAVAFLRSPPLPRSVKAGYVVMANAAAATIPADLRHLLGMTPPPGSVVAGRALVGFLRWALGSSPSWHLALLRAGAPVPAHRFRQPLPVTVTGDP